MDTKTNYTKLTVIGFLLFALDTLTKSYFMENFKYGVEGQKVIIENLLQFKLVHNYGAAFSFLANWDGIQVYLLSGISLLAIFYLLYRIKTNKDNLSMNYAYTMVIAGALGNLYDRLSYGYVIDFIDVHIFNYDFPVFNIADICICIGFLLIIFLEIKTEKELKS